MRSVSAKWFEVGMTVKRTLEDGSEKFVKELYAINTETFGSAEEEAFKKELEGYEGEITKVAIAPYHEVFYSDNDMDDKYFKGKVIFFTVNERTGKEERTAQTYLVQAKTLEDARKNIASMMPPYDYAISSIIETGIIEVIEL